MTGEKQQAVFDLEGATCASCAFAIEYTARKVDGVDTIRVDTGKHEIVVFFHGNGDVLERVAGIVSRLGYRAVLKENNRKE